MISHITHHPTHQPTHPPTHLPNHAPTHRCGSLHRFQIFKQNWNISICSRLIDFLTDFGGPPCRGGLVGWWGWQCLGATPTHIYTHMHMHVINMINMDFSIMHMHTCVCMYMHVWVCKGPTQTHPHPPPSTPLQQEWGLKSLKMQ